MTKSSNTERSRQSVSFNIILGLVLLVIAAAILLIYVFSNRGNQDPAGGQQVEELSTAYPVGTPQGDAASAYPIATPPSDGMTPPYPPPESMSQDPPPEEEILEAEITTAAGVLGLVVDESYTVLHVEARGAADSAGIEAGDVLVSIGGVGLTAESIDEAKQAIWDSGEEGIEVVLTRDSQTIQLRVIPAGPIPHASTPTPVPPTQYYL